jgi:flagellar motor switch protein FliM
MATNDLVSNEEMSALLEAGGALAGAASAEKRRRVVPYNFKHPDRISKEQVRSIYLMHDLFAHNLSSSLPIFLRAISEVTLISVEQQAYVEYLYGLPDPAVLFTLSMHPLQGVAALEMNPSVAFPVIDRMLGGPGEALSNQRAVTEIEQRILEGFLKVVTDDLREAWKPLVELDLQIVGRETRPQMLQIVAPNEAVLSVVFHVQIAEARGMMSLCLPALTLEPVIERLSQSLYSRTREVPPAQTRALLDSLRQAAFPVAAEIRGTRALVEDLTRLAVGDVLRLEHRVGQPVTVSVGGVAKFTGDLAARDRRKAVRLREKIVAEAEG